MTWLTQCEEEGVVLALGDNGAPVIRGRRPSPALLEQLKEQKAEIQKWLERTQEQPRGRWGEVPPKNLHYRTVEPERSAEDFRRFTAWALRQPDAVRQWCQARAVAYYERTTQWSHCSYDLAAALDLLKWQRGKEELPDL